MVIALNGSLFNRRVCTGSRFLTKAGLVLVVLGAWQALTLAQETRGASVVQNYIDLTSGTRVEQLVTAALSRNADLLATRQRVVEAQGLLRQSGFRTNPGVNVSYGAGRILNSAGETQFVAAYNHIFELGGKRQRRIEVSERGVELARLEITDQERQLRAEIRMRFAEGLAAARNLDIAEQQLRLNQQVLKITEARVQEGEAPALDRGIVQVDVSRLESDTILFENQVQRALLAIKPIAGMPVEEPLKLAGELRAPPVTIGLTEALARALAERPDMRIARLEVDLRDAETRAARAEAVPNLVATGQYARTKSSFDQLGLNASGAAVPIRDVDNVLTAGVSIILPLRNKNQGNIQAATARAEGARLRLRFVEQSVSQEVRSAYTRYQAGQRAVAIFDDRVLNRSLDNLRVIRSAFEAGELRIFDVVNEQRRLTDTQRAYTEVLREYYISLVELERALGVPLQ